MPYKNLTDLNRVISLAKPEGVIRTFWASYQEGLQYQAWLEGKQAEYDVIFPKTEEVLATETDEEGNEAPVMTTDEEGNEVQATKQVPIDYSENESYVTFDEWMAEREVVTLTRTVFDEEGNEVEESYEADGDLIRSFKVGVIPPFEESDLHHQKVANNAQVYLDSTDWIVTKIAELQLEGENVDALKTKYATELAERKVMRELI
jgi:hypothetical protein